MENIKYKTGAEVMRALRLPNRVRLHQMRRAGTIDFIKTGPRSFLYPDWVCAGILKKAAFSQSIEATEKQNEMAEVKISVGVDGVVNISYPRSVFSSNEVLGILERAKNKLL